MLPNVSLSEYRTAFTQAVDNMTELNHPQIPTAAMQALHFIVRLDPDRFKEFTASALNAHRSGGAFPDTIQKASDAAKAYIPLVRVSNQRATNPMVLSARFTGTCHFCGKVGHKESECWNKKSSGDSPSSSDVQQSKKASNASAGSEPNPKQDGGSAPAQQQRQGNSKKNKNSKSKQKAAYSSEVKASSGHVPDIFGFPVCGHFAYRCKDRR